MKVFTLQKLTNTTSQGFSFYSKEATAKHCTNIQTGLALVKEQKESWLEVRKLEFWPGVFTSSL